MVKLAIVDIDGVVANVDARFARAEEIKLATLNDRSVQLGERERTATDRYWRAVFDPEQVHLDTLIEGAAEALDFIEEQGYHLIFLTSRPESMRKATEHWFWSLSPDVVLLSDEWHNQIVMKASAFQYTKTIIWKAGMVQTLAALYGAEKLLVVDDEQANVNELMRYTLTLPDLIVAKSLADAVRILDGESVEQELS